MNHQINGFAYNYSGSNEMSYLTGHDTHMFHGSRTLYLEFESDFEQDSMSISFLLNQQQFENFNVDDVITAFEQILAKHKIKIAYNIHAIREELDRVKKGIEDYLHRGINLKIKSFSDFSLIRYFHDFEDASKSTVLLKGPMFKLSYAVSSKTFVFDEYELKKEVVEFEDKQLFIDQLEAKLREYLK